LRELEHRVLVQDTALARPEASRAAPWHANGDEPVIVPADVKPVVVHVKALRPRRRALATAALALSALALVLFWRGFAATLIAALGVLCGTIARRARTPEAPAARRATVAVVTGVVAFAASLGLVVYRYVTPDGERADPTEASDDRETTDTTEAPDDRETGNQTPPSTVFRGGLTTTDRLRTGQCFNNINGFPPAAPGRSISELRVVSWTVDVVPCEGPHHQEIYHGFTLPAGPYPGDEQAEALSIDSAPYSSGTSWRRCRGLRAGVLLRLARPHLLAAGDPAGRLLALRPSRPRPDRIGAGKPALTSPDPYSLATTAGVRSGRSQ